MHSVAIDELWSQALALGEQRGVVQTFIDFGPECIAQLRSWLGTHPTEDSGAWANHVLQMWERQFRERRHGAIANLLTPRELDILNELANEHSNKVIAKNLLISPETVKHHLKSIFTKLGVQSREEAILAGRRNALLA